MSMPDDHITRLIPGVQGIEQNVAVVRRNQPCTDAGAPEAPEVVEEALWRQHRGLLRHLDEGNPGLTVLQPGPITDRHPRATAAGDVGARGGAVEGEVVLQIRIVARQSLRLRDKGLHFRLIPLLLGGCAVRSRAYACPP